MAEDDEKFDTLASLLQHLALPPHTVIFCNSASRVESLAEQLRGQGYAAVAVHLEMDPRDCELALLEFRRCASSILVASDQLYYVFPVSMKLVINYDSPTCKERYQERASLGILGFRDRRSVIITFVARLHESLDCMQELEKHFQVVGKSEESHTAVLFVV